MVIIIATSTFKIEILIIYSFFQLFLSQSTYSTWMYAIDNKINWHDFGRCCSFNVAPKWIYIHKINNIGNSYNHASNEKCDTSVQIYAN